MKSEGPRPFLGYLAAFTCGMLTMGIIVLITRVHPVDSNRKAAGLDEDSGQAAEETQPQEARKQASRAFESRPGVKKITPLPPISGESSAGSEEEPESDRTAGPGSSSSVNPIRHPAREESLLANAKAGARISGRVTLEGKPPAEKRLPLDPTCGALFEVPPTTRFYVVSKDKGLGDVFIFVSKGIRKQHWPSSAQKRTLAYEKCFLEPYVFAVQTGQPITVKNQDNILHNLHVVSSSNTDINRAVLKNSEIEIVFKEPELFIRFKCDVHPWEFAYASVVDHPFFAVSDLDGKFAISELPPGEYELEAHHRKAGVLRKKVTVRANEESQVDFKFQPALEQMSPRGRAEFN